MALGERDGFRCGGCWVVHGMYGRVEMRRCSGRVGDGESRGAEEQRWCGREDESAGPNWLEKSHVRGGSGGIYICVYPIYNYLHLHTRMIPSIYTDTTPSAQRVEPHNPNPRRPDVWSTSRLPVSQ